MENESFSMTQLGTVSAIDAAAAAAVSESNDLDCNCQCSPRALWTWSGETPIEQSWTSVGDLTDVTSVRLTVATSKDAIIGLFAPAGAKRH